MWLINHRNSLLRPLILILLLVRLRAEGILGLELTGLVRRVGVVDGDELCHPVESRLAPQCDVRAVLVEHRGVQGLVGKSLAESTNLPAAGEPRLEVGGLTAELLLVALVVAATAGDDDHHAVEVLLQAGEIRVVLDQQAERLAGRHLGTIGLVVASTDDVSERGVQSFGSPLGDTSRLPDLDDALAQFRLVDVELAVERRLLLVGRADDALLDGVLDAEDT